MVAMNHRYEYLRNFINLNSIYVNEFIMKVGINRIRNLKSLFFMPFYRNRYIIINIINTLINY